MDLTERFKHGPAEITLCALRRESAEPGAPEGYAPHATVTMAEGADKGTERVVPMPVVRPFLAASDCLWFARRVSIWFVDDTQLLARIAHRGLS